MRKTFVALAISPMIATTNAFLVEKPLKLYCGENPTNKVNIIVNLLKIKDASLKN
jgi:hypothetical protein